MRMSHLLALATVAGTALNSAGAQEARSVPAPDARGRSSESRVLRWDDDGAREHRAALGVGTLSSGTLRDTLGVLVTSVTRGSPAEQAGIEEGNRIAAINSVSLRVNAADVEDSEMSGTMTRRLTRELAKSKPGDEVELRLYREGRTSALKVRTVDADSLFRRRDAMRTTRSEMDDRPALGFGIGSSGSRRDTLGVLVTSVADSTPAARAGLEEGNRIASIGKVNLRLAREDAGDRFLAQAKAHRMQRELAALKPGDNVTLRVYADGQFKDVTMKVARAGDLPRQRGMMFMGDGMGMMPPMPPMPSSPRMGAIHIDLGPEIRQQLGAMRLQFEELRPQLERMRVEMQPQLERMRDEVPRLLERLRIRPDIHIEMDDDAMHDASRAVRRVRTSPVTRTTTM